MQGVGGGSLPPAQCGAHPRMPLLGCGLGDNGDAAPHQFIIFLMNG